MNEQRVNTAAVQSIIVRFSGIKSYLFQLLFIALAVALPAAAHIINAPVKYLLPMHWAVILAGLVYGWRGGAISGFLAPMVSFLITGMPPAYVLLPMTTELFIYGSLTGYLRENFKLSAFASVAIALISGRAVYFLIAIKTGMVNTDTFNFLVSSFLPGIFAALAQVAIIPFIAKWWVNKENKA